jgi:hypothetical protein
VEKKKVEVSVDRDGWMCLCFNLGNSENSATYHSRDMSIGEMRKFIKELERACAQAERNRKENYDKVGA